MTAHARTRLELDGVAGGRRPFRERHWKVLLLALGLLTTVMVVLGVNTGGLVGERRALVRMSPEDRRALFDRSYESASAVCAQAQVEPALDERCQAAASFLLSFPECGKVCRAFAEEHRESPTR